MMRVRRGSTIVKGEGGYTATYLSLKPPEGSSSPEFRMIMGDAGFNGLEEFDFVTVTQFRVYARPEPRKRIKKKPAADDSKDGSGDKENALV